MLASTVLNLIASTPVLLISANVNDPRARCNNWRKLYWEDFGAAKQIQVVKDIAKAFSKFPFSLTRKEQDDQLGKKVPEPGRIGAVRA